MPYANIGDVKLHYEIYGSEYALSENGARKKPTIVAIHGGLDPQAYDIPTLKEAAAFAQVIFLSRRGCARSIDQNPKHWNLRQWADDLYHFCNTLGLEKPFIHGASMGGWVAQVYASIYQNQAAGIILSDTEATIEVADILDAYESCGGKEARAAAEAFFADFSAQSSDTYARVCAPYWSNHPIPAEWIKNMISDPRVNQYFNQHDFLKMNLFEDIKKITLPVLFLSGTINCFHLLRSAQKAAEAMVNAHVKFVAFENYGLVAMDAKEEALAEIKLFIERHFNNTASHQDRA